MGDVSVTEARATLPDLLQRVGEGEDVVLTRHGRPVAVIVRPDRLRARAAGPAQALAQDLHDALASARQSPRSGTLSPKRADQMVAELRADRER